LSDAKESALERLSEDAAREFPHLSLSRRDRQGLQDRRERLARLPHDDDASVVLMGSWGRSEVTSGATMISRSWSMAKIATMCSLRSPRSRPC
jgi:hypothetical protein